MRSIFASLRGSIVGLNDTSVAIYRCLLRKKQMKIAASQSKLCSSQ